MGDVLRSLVFGALLVLLALFGLWLGVPPEMVGHIIGVSLIVILVFTVLKGFRKKKKDYEEVEEEEEQEEEEPVRKRKARVSGLQAFYNSLEG